MLEKLHIFIALVAALVSVIYYGFIVQFPLDLLSINTIIIIILFYFIGLVVRVYFTKKFQKDMDIKSSENEINEQEETNEIADEQMIEEENNDGKNDFENIE